MITLTQQTTNFYSLQVKLEQSKTHNPVIFSVGLEREELKALKNDFVKMIDQIDREIKNRWKEEPKTCSKFHCCKHSK